MIQSRIVLDSINPAGKRLTTWLLTYPRFIHSEFMTHRQFSRNSASSRAIPSKKIIHSIRDNPALFEQVGRANTGMQAQEVLNEEDTKHFHLAWLTLANKSLDFVNNWSPSIAKQVVNRAIEPWMHMTVLATACDHSNFFRLRAHPMAQPEFQVLAYQMLGKYLKSEPKEVAWGEWHLPGVGDDEYYRGDSNEEKLHACVGLACRASYSAFEDGISKEDAKRIHDRGVLSKHWSPFEHAAQAVPDDDYPRSNFDGGVFAYIERMPHAKLQYRGLSHWRQYRKLFTDESGALASRDDLRAIFAARPDWIKL